RYSLTVRSAVTDHAGNGLSQGGFVSDFSSSFVTGADSDSTAPALIGLSPANGATGIPVNARIVAVFSEPISSFLPVAATLTPSAGGPALAGAFTRDATGAILTFTPTAALAASTGYTITILDARDLAGNALPGLPIVSTFTTNPATSATSSPNVALVVPATGAAAVAVSTTVQVCFSEPIQPASVNGTTFQVTLHGAAIAGAITLDAAVTCATLTPSQSLAGGAQYT